MPYEVGPDGMMKRVGPQPEKTPADDLRSLFLGVTRSQNRLPAQFTGEQPQGVLYYGTNHIQDVEEVREKINSMAVAQNISEFSDYDGRKLSVQECLSQIDRNLEFSKDVHKSLGL